MADPRIWRVIDVLDWSRLDLAAKGVEKPRLDAEILLSNALGMSRIELYTNFDRPLQQEELKRFKAMLTRRRKRESTAYILGKKEFFSLEFMVSPAVLVPRPETEQLVERILDMTDENSFQSLAEPCTGSGCVAVAIAHHRRSMRIWAGDVSGPALDIARENASRHGVSISFSKGNLLKAFPEGISFDFIVANPPYVPSREIAGLAPEIGFEPRMALDGGPDGLRFIKGIIDQAAQRLSPGGRLLLETGSDQGRAACELLEKNGSFINRQILPDLAGLDRVVVAERGV